MASGDCPAGARAEIKPRAFETQRVIVELDVHLYAEANSQFLPLASTIRDRLQFGPLAWRIDSKPLSGVATVTAVIRADGEGQMLSAAIKERVDAFHDWLKANMIEDHGPRASWPQKIIDRFHTKVGEHIQFEHAYERARLAKRS